VKVNEGVMFLHLSFRYSRAMASAKGEPRSSSTTRPQDGGCSTAALALPCRRGGCRGGGGAKRSVKDALHEDEGNQRMTQTRPLSCASCQSHANPQSLCETIPILWLTTGLPAAQMPSALACYPGPLIRWVP
jgi:hypothetical protein